MKSLSLKIISTILTMTTLLSVFCIPVAAVNPKISVDGKPISISSTEGAAFLDSKNTIEVPLVGFAKAMGGSATWNKSTGIITVKRQDKLVYTISIGKKGIQSPYGTLIMKNAPIIKNNIVYIELKSAAGIFGYDYKASNGAAELTKNVNGVVGDYIQLYSDYSTRLSFAYNLTSAVTCDLDGDGYDELIYVEESRSGYGWNLTVEKRMQFLDSKNLMDDFNIVGNRGSSAKMCIYKDANGKEYLGITRSQYPAYSFGFFSQNLEIYTLAAGKLKIINSISYSADNATTTNGTSSINGKTYKGKAKFTSELKKYIKVIDILEYQESSCIDKTNAGSNILQKGKQEKTNWSNFLNKAILSPAQKIKYGVTKDLVGANLEGFIDTSKLQYSGEGEGAAEYKLMDKDGVAIYNIYADSNILGSIVALKGADILGIKVGTSTSTDAANIFGKGKLLSKASDRFMAAAGTVSSLYYHFGDYQIEFFLDKDSVVIGVFIRAFEGAEPK